MEINKNDLSTAYSQAKNMHAAELTRFIANNFPGVSHGRVHAILSDTVAELASKVSTVHYTMGGSRALLSVARWLVDDWAELIISGVGMRLMRDPAARTPRESNANSHAMTYNAQLNRLIFKTLGMN